MQAILNDHGLANYKICNYSIGNDEQIHVLIGKNIPELNGGMFVPTESNTNYQAISLTVDWQQGKNCHYKITDFGAIKPKLHFIQKFKDGFLFHMTNEILLFDSGYDHHGQFSIKQLNNSQLSENKAAIFLWQGLKINSHNFRFRNSKVLFLDKTIFYYTQWRDDTSSSFYMD